MRLLAWLTSHASCFFLTGVPGAGLGGVGVPGGGGQIAPGGGGYGGKLFH